MSILEENVIDSASIENGILILTISDHLKWDNEHLFLLQEKINSYIQYIESGQIFEDFGESSYETIEIQLIYKYKPNENYRKFLYHLEGALLKLKLRFSHGTISYFYS
ncbi:DUF6572 domain-containing protein [Neisseria maigaei]|uniref:DUF6572 domain-containing protein n=1 Tax=Neisseria maigaei TaxID=2830651 RepID=UPI00265B2340|nr:DUF6572 domain-containing protein [Neisseria maigaei]